MGYAVLGRGHAGDDDVRVVGIELRRQMAAKERRKLLGPARFGRDVPYARRLVPARGDDALTIRAIHRAHHAAPVAHENGLGSACGVDCTREQVRQCRILAAFRLGSMQPEQSFTGVAALKDQLPAALHILQVRSAAQ